MEIQMVDLKNQYLKIKQDIDASITDVIMKSEFINGGKVKEFQNNLEHYLNVRHVIPCANGTDALQIAMMALNFKAGDEVIVPAFTYVATAEVIGLLGFTPIMVDVDIDSYNILVSEIEKNITSKTKAIVPVHMFGQSCDMDAIMKLAQKHNLYVIEDNAQAIGANYTNEKGEKLKTGTIAHIGCTSFFPSKNLGCYGDGGAIFTNDDELAKKIQMVANHGQSKKYYHEVIGCNSRLDTIQAAILDIKLRFLDNYSRARNAVANKYSEAFKDISSIKTPFLLPYSTHVFHQYTMQITNGKRDEFKAYLENNKIPSMIYYPVPLYKQNAFKQYVTEGFSLKNTELLCKTVISLPIHTEMVETHQEYIIKKIKDFFAN